MPPRIETQAEPIPGYRLIERLGGGGFGEVWKAEAPGGLLKAIKFVYGDLQTVGDSETARAEQELKALSRVKSVRHPFILSLERFDIQDGQLMIVSELADRNLWDRFRECRSQSLPGIPRVELLKYMEETSEALDHMNLELDLMHLDIKPQNLFLVGSHIKVADFGLVKDLEGLVASVTGGVTPVYASPETFEGYVSRFSDQYSLAIVFQELLTGHRPFNANNTRQLILAHLQGEPNLSSLPPSDRPIIARSLAKDPNQRYPNCQSLVQALLGVGDSSGRSAYRPELQDTPVAAPPTTMSREQAERANEPSAKEAWTPPKPKKTPSSVLDFSQPNGTNTASLVRTSALPSPTAPPTMGLPEEVGDGVLIPALVIGLGQVGRSMLERFRAELRARHGGLNRLPHIRLLGIDSDPISTPPLEDAEALAADETLLTRLSRPGRYLRGRNGLPALDDWLEPTMLYRIPRDLATSGIRALGRLAFIDNYRSILSRLRWDLEQITMRSALATATEHTGLQLRTSWPRVFVLAHLGGGTGSGCVLDLAFVVRHVLRMLRIGRPEVHGVFILPPAELAPGMDLCLANAHAALTELGRYMTVGQKFEGRYEARVAPIKDHGPAFTRCVFLQGGPEGERQRFREVVHSASDWLHRELLTPLGRTTAQARGELTLESGQKNNKLAPGRTPYQSFGLSAVILPRRTVVRRVARRALSHVLEQWAGKSAPGRAEQFQAEMQRECVALKVDPQTVITHFHAACQEQLERPPDVIFAAWMAPLRQLTPLGLPAIKAYHDALIESDRMLGGYDPKDSTAVAPMVVGDNPCVMPRILREAAEILVNQFEPPLVRQVLRFLDVPGERLGGAEDAVTQTIACLEDWLRTLEQQQDQITAVLRELPDHIRRDLAECERVHERAQKGMKIPPERRQLALHGLPERIQRFIILRYQLLTLQWTIAVYRSLRGRLSDQKKEISYVRGRLRDLQAQFLIETGGTVAEEALPRWKFVFPDRAERLDQVVEPALCRLTPEDWGELDLALQRTIDEDLGGLLRACQTGGQTHFDRLSRYLERTAVSCLMSRLRFDDVAAILLAEGNETMHLQNCLGRLRDEAAPEFMPGVGCTVRELTVVIAPDTPAGLRLLDAARKGITGVQLVAAANREEIAFYREVGGLALTDLPQFGDKGKKAYEAAFAVEHFTPHARQDVPEWAAKKKKDD